MLLRAGPACRRSPSILLAILPVALLVSLEGGCAPTSGNTSADAREEGAPTASSLVVPKAPDGGEVTGSCAAPASTSRRDLVCQRWSCSRASLEPAAWSGAPATCSPGRVDDFGYERALYLVNTYRFLAGVAAVRNEARWESAAQECALLAHANDTLSHHPPSNWACYSERGARASAVSLIANRNVAPAVDLFIADDGNETTLSHRRWLLTEKLGRLALGSTSDFGCVVVDGRAFDGEPGSNRTIETGQDDDVGRSASTTPPDAGEPARSWAAWPPPGPVPIAALDRTRVDALGWSIQSSVDILDPTKVEVRVDGRHRKVKASPLEAGMGSLSAVRFVPDGWSTEAGTRYDVRVELAGGGRIDFTVEPIHCDH